MFTTAGMSFSTKLAKLSGAGRAAPGPGTASNTAQATKPANSKRYAAFILYVQGGLDFQGGPMGHPPALAAIEAKVSGATYT
jgi:hypothetical protein